MACSIVALPANGCEEANEISRRICGFLSEQNLGVSFSFLFKAKTKTAEIVLVGGIAQVQNILEFIGSLSL